MFRNPYDPDLPDGPYNDPGPPATTWEAILEYVDIAGEDDPTREWILSDYDTWHRNPHYNGPPGRHPEDDSAEAYDDHYDAVYGPFRPLKIDDEIPF